MLTDANGKEIPDKLVGIQMFVSLSTYDLQKTTELSETEVQGPGFWTPLCHLFVMGTYVNCFPSLGFSEMRWLNKSHLLSTQSVSAAVQMFL